MEQSKTEDYFKGINRVEISGVQAIFLSQDEDTIVRDEYGNRIRYGDQWYYFCEEAQSYVGCYVRRAYGGGSFYSPPKSFFLCDK